MKGNENTEEIIKLNNESQEKRKAKRIQANKGLQFESQQEWLAAEAEKDKRDAERDKQKGMKACRTQSVCFWKRRENSEAGSGGV